MDQQERLTPIDSVVSRGVQAAFQPPRSNGSDFERFCESYVKHVCAYRALVAEHAALREIGERAVGDLYTEADMGKWGDETDPSYARSGLLYNMTVDSASEPRTH